MKSFSKVETSIFYLILFLFLAWVLSFENTFLGGDRFSYSIFFNAVKKLELHDAFHLYRNALGSQEPGYFGVSYLLKNIFTFNQFTYFLNITLALLILKNCDVLKVPKLWLFLIFTNFYLFVLFFSAERLKLALIFFLTAALVRNSIGLVLFLLAILTHVQIVLLFLVYILLIREEKWERLKKILINKWYYYIPLIFFIFYFLQEHILRKLPFYIGHFQWVDGLKSLLFFLLTLGCASRQKTIRVCLSFSVLLLASVLFGGERITIFSYLVFLVYSLVSKKLVKLNVLFALYFSFKGLLFLISGTIAQDGFWLNLSFLYELYK